MDILNDIPSQEEIILETKDILNDTKIKIEKMDDDFLDAPSPELGRVQGWD